MKYSYFPLLKSKAGELAALKHLEDNAHKGLYPILEIVPPEYDTGKEKSLDFFLTKLAKKIANSWNSSLPLAIDDNFFDTNVRTEEGALPTAYLCEELSKYDCPSTICFSLNRPESWWKDATSIPKVRIHGLIFRITKEELVNPIETIERIEEKAALLGLPTKNLSVLIDLKILTAGNSDEAVELSTDFLNRVPSGTYKQVILSASAFPESMSGILKGSVQELRRSEIDFFNAVLRDTEEEHLFAFSDYGVVAPGIVVLDVKRINPAAKIRYAREKNWLVFKGPGLKSKNSMNFSHFYALALSVTKHACYRGPSYSWGDQQIHDCSKRLRTGNLTTWVTIDTNRHITETVMETSSLLGR